MTPFYFNPYKECNNYTYTINEFKRFGTLEKIFLLQIPTNIFRGDA